MPIWVPKCVMSTLGDEAIFQNMMHFRNLQHFWRTLALMWKGQAWLQKAPKLIYFGKQMEGNRIQFFKIHHHGHQCSFPLLWQMGDLILQVLNGQTLRNMWKHLWFTQVTIISPLGPLQWFMSTCNKYMYFLTSFTLQLCHLLGRMHFLSLCG